MLKLAESLPLRYDRNIVHPKTRQSKTLRKKMGKHSILNKRDLEAMPPIFGPSSYNLLSVNLLSASKHLF